MAIPIFIDNVDHPPFELREGDNLDEVSAAFVARAGMHAVNLAALRSAAVSRLGCEPLGLKLAVVVAYEDDAVDTAEGCAGTVLWELVTGALRHGMPGDNALQRENLSLAPHLILVANGFALDNTSNQALREACLATGTRNARCGSVTVVEVSEVVGFGAAVNLALDDAHRNLLVDPANRTAHREAVVVVSSGAAALRPGLATSCRTLVEGGNEDGAGPAAAEGCSVWGATTSIAAAHGAPRLVFVPPVRPLMETLGPSEPAALACFACAAPLPLLAFPLGLWRLLGPLDEGFFLQGAPGEWAHRARRRQLLVDGGGGAFGDMAVRFLRPLGPRRRDVIAARPVPSSALSASTHLAALDADHLWVHLVADHCTCTDRPDSAAGNGARCHEETVGAPRAVLEERARDENARAAAEEAALLEASEEAGGPGGPDGGSDGGPGGRRAGGVRLLLDAADWQAGWSGIGPSAVALAGWSDELRVGAVMVLYDDALGLVDALLPDLLRHVHHTAVLVSAEPWHSAPRDVGPTLRLLAGFVEDARFAGRLSVMPGLWRSEEAQRRFGNVFLAARGLTHALVVDGDEFWHPAELHRSLCLVAHTARRAASDAAAALAQARAAAALHDATDPLAALAAKLEGPLEEAAAWAGRTAAPFARAHMATYWRSVRGVVAPPERLRILWLVRVDLCDWTRDREIDCALPAAAVRGAAALAVWRRGGGAVAAEDVDAAADAFDGLMLDPSAGVCHHLSYVRTTDQLVRPSLLSYLNVQDTPVDRCPFCVAVGAGSPEAQLLCARP